MHSGAMYGAAPTGEVSKAGLILRAPPPPPPAPPPGTGHLCAGGEAGPETGAGAARDCAGAGALRPSCSSSSFLFLGGWGASRVAGWPAPRGATRPPAPPTCTPGQPRGLPSPANRTWRRWACWRSGWRRTRRCWRASWKARPGCQAPDTSGPRGCCAPGVWQDLSGPRATLPWAGTPRRRHASAADLPRPAPTLSEARSSQAELCAAGQALVHAESAIKAIQTESEDTALSNDVQARASAAQRGGAAACGARVRRECRERGAFAFFPLAP